MGNYKDLEIEHSIKDVLSVDEYCNKVHQMWGASKELYRLRCQIKGHDLIPSYDAVRFWPVTISAYSLLEQCLKLLVSIRTPNYLITKGQAFKDGHDLVTVFDRLTELDRDLLEQCYVEYASFIEFPLQSFPTLGAYLQKIGKGQITWRYFLLEFQPEDLSKLPAPLSPDILLEVTRGVVSILMAKAFTDHGLNTIHRRLEHSLERALCHPAPLINLSTDNFNDWVRQNNGIINAFSHYIRVGALDKYDKPMRKWLEESVEWLRKNRLDNFELEQFFLLAKTRCVTWNGKQFEYRNPLPDPISSLGTYGGWNIEWSTDTGSWQGEVDEIDTIPMEIGQLLETEWHNSENAPKTCDMESGSSGQLIVRRNGHTLVTIDATIIGVTSSRSYSDDIHILSASFMKASKDNLKEGYKSLTTDFICIRCSGTGFCSICAGEASDRDPCQSCSPVNGLCSDCKGYGRDGDYILAQSAKREPNS